MIFPNNTLVGWIRSLVKFAYEKCPHHIINFLLPKPHEVRALAWRADIGPQNILSAACWSNHTTFTSFYLKDISIIKEEIHSLGPLVAAQKVIAFSVFLFLSTLCIYTPLVVKIAHWCTL